MSVSVSMPQLGESVTEGTVTRWLKREGERVEADEPLLEVSTDKVDTEIPSPGPTSPSWPTKDRVQVQLTRRVVRPTRRQPMGRPTRLPRRLLPRRLLP